MFSQQTWERELFLRYWVLLVIKDGGLGSLQLLGIREV